MNNIEFVNKLVDIARNYKTLYVYGCFGAPMTAANRERYCNHTSYNKQASRQKMIRAATPSTFGFDCVCLIKGVLWGWNGNKNKTYGGATYASNGVPDIGADTMIKRCSNISTDFSNLEIGEAVWMSGHIGIYIGNGLAVECTPKWDNCVQITACNCTKAGYNRRDWTKHGKLPYIEYVKEEKPVEKEPTLSVDGKKSIDEIANEVIAGKWYAGAARKSALTKAGYNYDEVQNRVNEILTSGKKSITTVAKEIINGKWGNGAARKSALKKAGYTEAEIKAIQTKVNELM